MVVLKNPNNLDEVREAVVALVERLYNGVKGLKDEGVISDHLFEAVEQFYKDVKKQVRPENCTVVQIFNIGFWFGIVEFVVLAELEYSASITPIMLSLLSIIQRLQQIGDVLEKLGEGDSID